MQTVNLIEAGIKANTPSPSAVAVPPGKVIANKQALVESVGKILPMAVDTEVPRQETSRQETEKTVAELNRFVQNIQRGIQFSVDEESGRDIVTVTDSDTGEEIRKFPSDEILAVAAQIAETLALPENRAIGLFVNRLA